MLGGGFRCPASGVRWRSGVFQSTSISILMILLSSGDPALVERAVRGRAVPHLLGAPSAAFEALGADRRLPALTLHSLLVVAPELRGDIFPPGRDGRGFLARQRPIIGTSREVQRQFLFGLFLHRFLLD